MTNFVNKIWILLTPREKLFVLIIFIMMLISSVLELLGIGLIMPVIALLSRPELIEQNKYLHFAYTITNSTSHIGFLIKLCFLLIFLYFIKNAFLTFQCYLQTQFVLNKGASLANKLFSNYIHAPYKYHLKHNSGYLLGNINMVQEFAVNAIVPLLIIFTEFFVVSAIFIMLLYLSPITTICLIISALVIVTGIYFPLRNINYKLGKASQVEMLEINKCALQGIKVIKESKVRNAEDYFARKYKKHRSVYSKTIAQRVFLGNVPRFLIEILVVLLGFGTLLILIMNNNSLGNIILTISLFAASVIRLMPSMTRIQYNLAMLRQYSHSFNIFFDDIFNFETENKTNLNVPFQFKNTIVLNNISFAYENMKENVISSLNLTIEKNMSIALVGPTGCGKTTLADIILGLLKPSVGNLEVDNIDINNNLAGWQQIIGYVPQSIFLLDDTVRANVAFGVESKEIDDNRVKECLKLAQILCFIESLYDGINSVVGENGVRLSGGQRQRIGIARALYHKPQLIILDEATSSLDNDTEKAFIDALNMLKGKLTIIMIAHRLTTVENCDRIINMRNNKKT